MSEFVDVTSGSAAKSGIGSSNGLRQEVETFVPGGASKPVSRAPETIEQISRSPGGSRSLSQSVKAALDAMEATGVYGGVAPKQDAAASEPAPATQPVGDAPKPAAEPAPAPSADAKPAAPDGDDPARSYERVVARNKQLLAELEATRAKTSSRELTPREKALQDAESLYFEDPARALRQFISVAMGVDDPTSKAIDEELSGLYQDLTATELGVPLGDAQKAQREAARTRQLLARDKRERSAEAMKAAQPQSSDPEAAQQAKTLAAINGELARVGADGKSLSARYPLTMQLSEHLHGVKPEELLWRAIKNGIATGEIDERTPDDKIVELAAQKLERLHQDIAARIDQARPQATKPASAERTSDVASQTGGPPKQEARTITSASASMAPATTPATPTTENRAEAPPKFKSERERIRWLAQKHFGSV